MITYEHSVIIVIFLSIALLFVSSYFLIPKKTKEGIQIKLNLGKNPSVVVNKKGSLKLFSFCLDRVIEERISIDVMEQAFEVWQLIIAVSPVIATPKMEINQSDSLVLEWINGNHHFQIGIRGGDLVEYYYFHYESGEQDLNEKTNGPLPSWTKGIVQFFSEEDL